MFLCFIYQLLRYWSAFEIAYLSYVKCICIYYEAHLLRIPWLVCMYTHITLDIILSHRARYSCQIIDRHKIIQLAHKARGCTASGRTASYFYIISTWPPRYCVPSVPPFLPSSPSPASPIVTFCRSLWYFWKLPQIYSLNPRSPVRSSTDRRCIMFLGGEPRYTYIHQKRGFVPHSRLSTLPSSPPLGTPHCVPVYIRSERFLS